MDRVIPIIIPSLEPSECLIELVNGLRNKLRDRLSLLMTEAERHFKVYSRCWRM